MTRLRSRPSLPTGALILAMLACGGCSESDPEEDKSLGSEPFGSGSRLRWMVLDGGQGAISPTALFDTELNEICYVLPTAGGIDRCVPFSHGGGVYADAACTEPGVPVEEAPGSCGAPSRFQTWVDYFDPAPGCSVGGVSVSTYRRTDIIVPGYLPNEEGECELAGVDAYTTELMAPSEFVVFEHRVQPLDDDLARELLVGDDGTYWASGGHDVVRDVWCNAMEANGSKFCFVTQAVNQESGSAFAFADAACTEPAVSECEENEAYVYARSYDCDPSMVVNALGPPQDGYGTDTETCALVEEPVLPFVEEIPTTAFPKIDAIDFGIGVVRGTDWGRSGVRLGGSAQWTDTSRNAPCQLISADGGSVCLPEHLRDSWFIDDTCTELAWRTLSDPCGTTTPDYVLTSEDSEMECGEDTPVLYERGETYAGSLYSISYETGACELADVVGDAFYLSGPEVPIEDFPFFTSRMLD